MTRFFKILIQRLLEKSPIKSHLVRNLQWLSPHFLNRCPSQALTQFRETINCLVDSKRFCVELCDSAISEMAQFIERYSAGIQFDHETDRLDELWYSLLHCEKQLQNLWSVHSVVESCLLLSHGQAGVERGFSINKATMTTNMADRTLVAQRHVIDHIQRIGGIENFIITPELRLAVTNARNKYRLFLESKKKEEEADSLQKKRLKDEEDVMKMKEKRARLSKDISALEESADKLALKAESAKSFKYLLESNALRISVRDKKNEIARITDEISMKEKELCNV